MTSAAHTPKPPNTPAAEVTQSVDITITPCEAVIDEDTYNELLKTFQAEIFKELMLIPDGKRTKENIFLALYDYMHKQHLFKFSVNGYDIKVRVPTPNCIIHGVDIIT